jgi:hypothetical protein
MEKSDVHGLLLKAWGHINREKEDMMKSGRTEGWDEDLVAYIGRLSEAMAAASHAADLVKHISPL